MNNKYKTAVLFGALHGVNDFIAGFLLSDLSVSSFNTQTVTVSFLLYTVIAFGGQLPAGIIVDKFKRIKIFSLLSVVFMITAILCFYINIFYAIFFSAVASAFIHVCGGAATYLSDNKSSALSGIFTSPGVVGLIIGGIAGAASFSFFYVFIAVLIVLFLLMIRLHLPDYKILKTTQENTLLDTHDFFMLALLLAIAFRSLLWNVMHMICQNNNTWLYAIALSAFSGKLMGGFIADKTDWKRFVLVSMISSAILLNAGKNYLPVFCLGVALLQSAVPVALLLMQQYLKNSPATGAGLSLGLSIVLGGIPPYIEQFRIYKDNKILLILLSIAFLFTNFLVIRSKKNLV